MWTGRFRLWRVRGDAVEQEVQALAGPPRLGRQRGREEADPTGAQRAVVFQADGGSAGDGFGSEDSTCLQSYSCLHRDYSGHSRLRNSPREDVQVLVSGNLRTGPYVAKEGAFAGVIKLRNLR